jgi:Bacterial PH domain
MQPMKFPSKKDPWVTGLLWTLILLMFAVSSFMVILSTNVPAPFPLILVPICVPLFFGVLLMWVFFSTGCEITAEHFAVRSGPFHFRIPLERIAKVAPRRKIFTPAWGFALSFDRIHVWYQKKNGNVAWLPVAVSPEDKAEFLRELARAVPSLQVKEG